MIKLETRIVAFVDLLGYKEMVIHDCENPSSSLQYVNKLYGVFGQTKNLIPATLDIRFFSDCVVLAAAPSFENFGAICGACRSLQSAFFAEQILVRGGVSFGKHFSESDFLFSRGLVDAYLLELQKARTPRIVISPDLINLYQQHDLSFLTKERDGLYFIDYIGCSNDPRVETEIAQRLVDQGINDPKLAEKMIWLGEYANHRLGGDAVKLAARFKKVAASEVSEDIA